MHDYSFDTRKKIWNKNVQRKFCQESSNLPFCVPGDAKLWYFNICFEINYIYNFHNIVRNRERHIPNICVYWLNTSADQRVTSSIWTSIVLLTMWLTTNLSSDKNSYHMTSIDIFVGIGYRIHHNFSHGQEYYYCNWSLYHRVLTIRLCLAWIL
jgi:hypothetical protein